MLQHEVLELPEIIACAVESVTPLLESKRHVLSIRNDGARLRVEGDAGRLSQCVANLLTNAAKYTDPGGDIRIECLKDGADAVARVIDNGAVIVPELLPRLFDLFVQDRRTLDRAQGGFGIGLFIVKRLIEMHGGRVSAASRGVGRGSAFEIRLPLAEATGTRSDRSRTAVARVVRRESRPR